MRPVDDIRRIAKPKKHFNPHVHQHVHHPEIAAEIAKPEVLSQTSELFVAVHQSPNLLPGAAHAKHEKQHSSWHFRKSYVLVPFTMFVLIFGAYFGARFVSFANSVSTSRESVVQTISNNIGATLGPVIPGFKSLDKSDLAAAIANKKTINVLMLGYGGEGHSGQEKRREGEDAQHGA